MSEISKIALLVTLAAVMNILPQLAKKKDVVPTLLANLVLFLILSVTGSLWRYDVVKGLAVLYLVASFIAQGIPFTNSVLALIGGFSSTMKPIKIS